MTGTILEEDLRRNDGREGRPAYVAYKGKVYDVSSSKMWRGGVHVRRHIAGQDLTDSLAAAPHDESVFERVREVGELAVSAKSERSMEEVPPLLGWFLARHPHPISVHFPTAYVPAVAVLLILYLCLGNRNFEVTAYYVLWGGVVMTPVAMVLGATSWWFNYGRKFQGVYAGKIVLAASLLVVGVVALILRSVNSGALVNREPIGWVYFALVLVMVLLVSALGWLGDRIMYG